MEIMALDDQLFSIGEHDTKLVLLYRDNCIRGQTMIALFLKIKIANNAQVANSIRKNVKVSDICFVL